MFHNGRWHFCWYILILLPEEMVKRYNYFPWKALKVLPLMCLIEEGPWWRAVWALWLWALNRSTCPSRDRVLPKAIPGLALEYPETTARTAMAIKAKIQAIFIPIRNSYQLMTLKFGAKLSVTPEVLTKSFREFRVKCNQSEWITYCEACYLETETRFSTPCLFIDRETSLS